MTEAQLTGLARRLVSDGLLSEEKMREAQAKSPRGAHTLVSYLVENKLVPASNLALAAADEFGVPLVDLNAFELDISPYKKLSDRLIRSAHALPLYRRGRRLYVAVSDPTNQPALDEFKFATELALSLIHI